MNTFCITQFLCYGNDRKGYHQQKTTNYVVFELPNDLIIDDALLLDYCNSRFDSRIYHIMPDNGNYWLYINQGPYQEAMPAYKLERI